MQSSKVAIVRAGPSIPGAVAGIFELTGPPNLGNGSPVTIKLNLCFFRPYETGATTDPRVLEALIQYLRTRANDLDIALIESDATSARADLLFKWLGFTNLATKLGVRTINLSNDKRIKVPLPETCHLKALWMPKTLLDADYSLSLAKLKTHGLTKITCALKNQFGSIPYRGKSKWHPVLDQVIADANFAARPDFSIVDGIIAMEGVDGPDMGKPLVTNLLVGGEDPVAVDSVCARVMGFNPNSIGHIREAEKRSVGSQRYEIVGEQLSEIGEKFDYNTFYHTVETVIRKIRK
ncbi:MAG TPA: DUF362 domain-containing protein [Candidatus Angelobacter sp.]|nr:DUF362 domain-containing protein [Candidatus Angelobacter sp.]